MHGVCHVLLSRRTERVETLTNLLNVMRNCITLVWWLKHPAQCQCFLRSLKQEVWVGGVQIAEVLGS